MYSSRQSAITASMFSVLLALPVSAAVSVQTVFNFSAYSDGLRPTAPLLQGADGALYGTTEAGGLAGYGTVFKVNPDGTGYVTLHSFSTTGADGSNPFAGLSQASDGTLYGTTYGGGSFGGGTVFKIMPDGSGYAVLHSMNGTEGRDLYGGVIIGVDGALYGTAYFGGATSFYGTVFKLKTDGTGFAVLHTFTTNGNDGLYPRAGLCSGSDGALYGTTQSGGVSGTGTIFRITPDGSTYTRLHSFAASNDGAPYAGLIQAGNGALYGTTHSGSIFKINMDGTGYTTATGFGLFFLQTSLVQASDGDLYFNTVVSVGKIHTNLTGFATVYAFAGGESTVANLVQCSDGSLYGTAEYGGPANSGGLFKLKTDGTNYSLFHTYSGIGGGGYAPQKRLLWGSNGKLYGTTEYGGDSDSGTLFRVNPDGSGYVNMYSFSSSYGTINASAPTECSDGALYGVTSGGGVNDCGALYKINLDGTGFTTIYSFTFPGTFGYSPNAAVLEGLDGALYGVNYSGGLNGSGTVFKINKDGTGYMDLHSFGSGASDGSTPLSGLIQTSDGTLFGTTDAGGGAGFGTLFKLNSDGSNYAVLHTFGATVGDGQNPNGLIIGNDGKIYGTSRSGGANFGGTVFKLNPDGTGYTVLASPVDYTYIGVSSTVLQGPDGALYGMIGGGGLQYGGSFFKVNTDGSGYAELSAFNYGSSGGYYLYAGLVKGSDGALYGQANLGGTNGAGCIFKFLGYAGQSIAFGALPNQTVGSGSISLSATASSGLPVSFAVTSGPATLNGTTLTLTGIGDVTVQATQSGDASYAAATPVSQTFTVTPASPANQTITFPAIADQTFGVAPLTLNASASSGLPVALAVTGGPASLSGNTLTITGAGSVTVQATQAGSANFLAATPVVRTFTVNPAPAIVTLTDLYATADGTPKTATSTTTPPDLAVNVTYNGSATPPVSEGTYLVVATVTDPNYTGSATGTLVILSVLSQTLDQLAGLEPGSSSQSQTANLRASKFSIVLNFSKANSDMLQLTAAFSAPPGIKLGGLTAGIACDGYADKTQLNAKGKSPPGNTSVSIKLTPSGAATITYSIRNKDLATALAASGLTRKTTSKSGEPHTLNVGLMLKTAEGSVYFYTESLNTLYKVSGKTGKCSLKQ